MSEIYVLGADEDNLAMLRDLPGHSWNFHPLLTPEELVGAEDLDIPDLLDRAREVLDEAEPPPDAVIGYWDFPVSSMVPILCEERGLTSAPLRAVVCCEHKYWSRLEQAKVTDDVPGFGLIELEGHKGTGVSLPEGVDFPVWVKPVKSASSALAFRVTDDAELDDALAEIREGIGQMGRPFEDVLSRIELPSEIAEVGAMAVLVEEEGHGRQATVEGYEQAGAVQIHGIIDSPTFPASPSFRSYQYPSRLPEPVQHRMVETAAAVIQQIGLTDSTFNVEFFWDEQDDRLVLLEVNPRHSQSHAWLFEQVDGVSNHESVVALALGKPPALPCHRGEHAVAAKCQVRRFTDGVVRRAPGRQQVAAIEEEIGRVHVKVLVSEGDRLSDQRLQDSYSFDLAHVFVAAQDEDDLVATFRRCVEALDISVEDVDDR
jgi:biotin carboxylase